MKFSFIPLGLITDKGDKKEKNLEKLEGWISEQNELMKIGSTGD